MSTPGPSATTKHYLVLFVTDYRKEHDFRAHKTFASKEAAIEEAKKFSNPPKEYRDDDEEDELEQEFEWEYTCPSSKMVFAEHCKVGYGLGKDYEGGAVVFEMSCC